MIRWIAALGAVVACFCLDACSDAEAAPVWVGDSHAVHRVDAGTGQIAQTFARTDTLKLAGTKDGGVWVLGKQSLARFGADGARLIDFDLKILSLKGAEHLAVDADRISVWVAEGKQDGEPEHDEGDGRARRIVRVDGTGKQTAGFAIPGRVNALSLGLDGSLWLLGNKTLWHYAPTGVERAAIDLKAVLKEKPMPTLLAVDSFGVWLWLAGEKQLLRLDGNAATPILTLPQSGQVDALAIDPKSGTLWVASGESLLAYRSDGTQRQAVDLKRLGIRHVGVLVVDGANSALWLGHEKGITRFSLASAQAATPAMATIALKDAVTGMGVSPFALAPTISIVSPPEGMLTNQALPELRLAYGADCYGEPCGFNPEYYQTYGLVTILNGQTPGGQLVYSPLGGEAILMPTGRLPEGLNTLLARATDSFGQQSGTVERRFTIDTVSPRISVLSPASGTRVGTPQLTIAGAVDEPGTIRLVGDGVALEASGELFSFPVTLRPGENVFTLSAIDRAGNQTTQTLRYSLAAGLQLTVTSPQNGGTATGGRVAVMGTFEGPPNTGITVNGIAAAIVGNRFLATVNLSPGENPISVTATTMAGETVSQTLKVNAGQSGAVEFRIEPNIGVAPHAVSIAVPTLPDRSMVRLDVDFDGDGAMDGQSAGGPLTFIYQKPGIYMANLRLDDFAGGIYTAAVPVIVQDATKLDIDLKRVWSDMNDALLRGDLEGALGFVRGFAKDKYRPVFAALMDRMPSIVSSYSVPISTTLSADYAEYAVTRTIDGSDYVFLVYFMRDGDGVWRIESM